MGKDFFIGKAALVFAFLGLSFGILFDFATALEKAVNVKVFSFFLDFTMTVFACIVSGCVMIAYSNGAFKGILFVVLCACFAGYMLTAHKFLFPLFTGIFYPLKKFALFFAKKLKNGKKSLKKVLHSGK